MNTSDTQSSADPRRSRRPRGPYAQRSRFQVKWQGTKCDWSGFVDVPADNDPDEFARAVYAQNDVVRVNVYEHHEFVREYRPVPR